jgi:hypothetical protein
LERCCREKEIFVARRVRRRRCAGRFSTFDLVKLFVESFYASAVGNRKQGAKPGNIVASLPHWTEKLDLAVVLSMPIHFTTKPSVHCDCTTRDHGFLCDDVLKRPEVEMKTGCEGIQALPRPAAIPTRPTWMHKAEALKRWRTGSGKAKVIV